MEGCDLHRQEGFLLKIARTPAPGLPRSKKHNMVNRDCRRRAPPGDRIKGVGAKLFALSRGLQAPLAEAVYNFYGMCFVRGQPFRVQIPICLDPL